MIVRRSGNIGFVEASNGQLFGFSTEGKGWDTPPPSFTTGMLTQRKIMVNGYNIIPMGDNNALPNKVAQLLDNFYAGEGILGKIQGLQYGQGPKLYKEEVVDNKIVRSWINPTKQEKAFFDRSDIERTSLKCLTDLTHMQGFFWRGYLNVGARIGASPIISKIEHVPYQKCRLVSPPDGYDEPQSIVVGDWPYPDPKKMHEYPMFDPANPFKHKVFMGYENVYSFCKDFMSVPRFYGAFGWIDLAGSLAGLLRTYNKKASAISIWIESPQAYWDEKEEELKKVCQQKGITYTRQILNDYMDNAFMDYTAGITGEKNAGSYLHTRSVYDDLSNSYVGWTVKTIETHIKDYVDAQIAIADKSNEAATSSFGLDPALANLIIDGKLSSGSEKLYSLKVYNATETAIPEMIMFGTWNKILQINTGNDNKLGFYRNVVEAESNVSPNNRVKANA